LSCRVLVANLRLEREIEHPGCIQRRKVRHVIAIPDVMSGSPPAVRSCSLICGLLEQTVGLLEHGLYVIPQILREGEGTSDPRWR